MTAGLQGLWQHEKLASIFDLLEPPTIVTLGTCDIVVKKSVVDGFDQEVNEVRSRLARATLDVTGGPALFGHFRQRYDRLRVATTMIIMHVDRLRRREAD